MDDLSNAESGKLAILKKAEDKMNADSASESEDDEDEDDDWKEVFDDEKDSWFWFSPSRNERVEGERPDRKWFEKSLLNAYIRVFWPMEDEWFGGTITKFRSIKMKHRVDYDDGDHEWIKMKEEMDRIQIYLEDTNSWATLRSVWPSSKKKSSTDTDTNTKPSWEERYDHTAEVSWYFNTVTGESTYEKPLELIEWENYRKERMDKKFKLLTLDGDAYKKEMDENWEKFMDDESGNPFWYNNFTGESSWNDPLIST